MLFTINIITEKLSLIKKLDCLFNKVAKVLM